MFEDSLIESAGKLKTRRSTTTSVSFLLQLGFMVVLVLIPLLFTEALPKSQLVTPLVMPPSATRMAPSPPRAARQIQSNIVRGQLRLPSRIPNSVRMIEEVAAPTTAVGVTDGAADGQRHGVLYSLLNSPAAVVVPKLSNPKRIVVSRGVIQGMLIHKVQPVYPSLARQARIEGSVTLQAGIGQDGSIQNLRLISGHPMLSPAAMDAVKQWKYKPYILNGEAVDVETTITVNFTLAGG